MKPQNRIRVRIETKQSWRFHWWLSGMKAMLQAMARFRLPAHWIERIGIWIADRMMRSLRYRIGDGKWQRFQPPADLRGAVRFTYRN